MDYDRCLPSNQTRFYDQNSWYSYPTSYPLPNTRDYPSPAPSDPSPGPRPHQQLDQGALYASGNDSMGPPLAQIESSIGPSRTLPRRQSSLKPGLLARRTSVSTYLRDQESSLHSPIQLPDSILPRADSPSADRYGDRSSLHSNSPHSPPVQLPPYHPGTPTSMASPYSPYNEHTRRSRTLSDRSSNFDGRGHSPALSSNSARTSLSSHGMESAARADSSRAVVAPARPEKKEPKHHKHRLRDVDRKNICLYHINNPNARQEDIGTAFGVERSTISKILKDKDRWLNISEEDESNEQTSKHRPSKFPEVEEEMLRSLQAWADGSVNITDQLIRQRALEIARLLHIPAEKFKGSSGWIENFKHRHDIKRGEWLKAVKVPVTHRYGGPISRSVLQAAAAATSAAAGLPPTPVLMPYDQQRVDAASDPSSHRPQAHASLPPPPWHQTPHSASQMVIDPSLQSSPQNHHHQHHDQQLHQPLNPIEHSPDAGYGVVDPYGALPIYGDNIQTGPAPARPPPTVGEAEDAVNTLLAYIDIRAPDLLKGDERDLLQHVKNALFQHANGLPYDRH